MGEGSGDLSEPLEALSLWSLWEKTWKNIGKTMGNDSFYMFLPTQTIDLTSVDIRVLKHVQMDFTGKNTFLALGTSYLFRDVCIQI